MLDVHRDFRCCDRFAETATAVRRSRRRLLKDAVLRAQDGQADGAPDSAAGGFPVPGQCRGQPRAPSMTSARTCL